MLWDLSRTTEQHNTAAGTVTAVIPDASPYCLVARCLHRLRRPNGSRRKLTQGTTPRSSGIMLPLSLRMCLQYKDGEEVTLWVNKVGPYHNPQETYKYYSLPFCRPDVPKTIRVKSDSLGAELEGNELEDSGIHIKFKSVSHEDRLWLHTHSLAHSSRGQPSTLHNRPRCKQSRSTRQCHPQPLLVTAGCSDCPHEADSWAGTSCTWTNCRCSVWWAK